MKAAGDDLKRDWALNTFFRTSVDAWVAQPLRGSLGPGGSREPQDLVNAALKLDFGLPISKSRLVCYGSLEMKLVCPAMDHIC